MIAMTYPAAGVALFFTGCAFALGCSSATQQRCVVGVFFFASAAASSAYLTVSESFPLEMRAIAIALFYAAGTALGGFAAPPLFGAHDRGGSRDALFGGYAFASVLMFAAALVVRRDRRRRRAQVARGSVAAPWPGKARKAKPAWGKLAAGRACCWRSPSPGATRRSTSSCRARTCSPGRAPRARRRWAPIAVILGLHAGGAVHVPAPFPHAAHHHRLRPLAGLGLQRRRHHARAMATYYAGRMMRKETVVRLAGDKLEEAGKVLRKHGILAVFASNQIPCRRSRCRASSPARSASPPGSTPSARSSAWRPACSPPPCSPASCAPRWRIRRPSAGG